MSDIDEKLLDDDINIIDDVEELPTEPEAQDKVETPSTEEVEPEKEESTVDEGEQEKQPPVEEEAPAPAPALATPTPITEDSLRSILSDLREEEYRYSKEVEDVYRDIQSRYYPNGISRVLTDSKTGLEIRTAQDVIDLSENPDLTIEEAERWRLVKQAELDAQVQEIERTTRQIAEQSVALKRGAERVQQKYADLFKAHPALERKVTAMYMQTVNIDKETNTILSAPIDIEEFYSNYLEPYQTAFSASNTPAAPTPKPAPTPSKDDRLDEHGDGGLGDGDDDDPDDFEAQLKKEFRS